MAADRSSSSSQIEKAPSTTTIAPSSTPNTGAAGLTVPAPMAPSQLPVSVMNRCAFSAALWLMAVDIQSLEEIGVCTPAHLSVCWVLCCGVVVVVGACWASAAGATTSTDRRARPIVTRSQRPRERSRSWSIVIILELLKLMDEVRGRGRRVAVGDGDRPVRDGRAGLLPILVDPLEPHRGHAPGLLGRKARVLVAAHAGLPDGDAGVGAVVGVEAVADGDGLEDHLAGYHLCERLVGVLQPEERGGDELRLVLQVAPQPLAGLRGGDRVNRRAAPGLVEDQLAGGQRGGVIGGGANRSGLG